MSTDTRCSKSWTDVNIDFKNRLLRHCCKATPYDFPEDIPTDFFDDSQYIRDRRRDSLAGLKHADCQSCWRDYDKGLGAYRDWMNKWSQADFSSKDLDKPHVSYVEIELDNTCDLSCIYCSSICSSRIAREEGVIHEDKTRITDIDAFKAWFIGKIGSITEPMMINFLGGEPTASSLFYELVEFVCDAASELDDGLLSIGICTNGNSKLHLMDRLCRTMDLSNVMWEIAISNESYGEVSELIRYGLDWDRFSVNIDRYISHPKVSGMTFSPTMNAFNLQSFARYIGWVHGKVRDKGKPFGWVGAHAFWPSELDIKNLPEDRRSHIDLARAELYAERDNPLLNGYAAFDNFLLKMRERISSDHHDGWLTDIRDFIRMKNLHKKTSKLDRLLDDV